MELYGFQQNLAKLQLQLEQAHQQFQGVSRTRGQVRVRPDAQRKMRLCRRVGMQAA